MQVRRGKVGREAWGERLKLGRAGMPGARQTYRSAHFSQRQTIHAAFLLQRKILDKNHVKHQHGGVRKFKVSNLFANWSPSLGQYINYTRNKSFRRFFFQQYKRGNRCVNWKYGKITVFQYFWKWSILWWIQIWCLSKIGLLLFYHCFIWQTR